MNKFGSAMKKIFKLILTFIVLFLFLMNAVFAISASSNYKIYGGQINPITGSGNFGGNNLQSGGQPIFGKFSSPNFKVQQGSSFSRYVMAVAEEAAGGGAYLIKDKMPPYIVTLKVLKITPTEVTIKYTTNENAITYLQYGRLLDLNISTGPERSYKETHSITLGNLSPFTKYSFVVHMRDVSGNVSESVNYSFRTLPLIRSIENVANFTAESVTDGVFLTWDNPKISTFEKVTIVRNTKHYPKSLTDGSEIFTGKREFFLDKNVEAGINYYYTIFAFNIFGDRSSGTITNIIFIIPPQPLEEEKKIEEKLIEMTGEIEEIKLPLFIIDFSRQLQDLMIQFRELRLRTEKAKRMELEIKEEDITKYLEKTITDLTRLQQDLNKAIEDYLRLIKQKEQEKTAEDELKKKVEEFTREITEKKIELKEKTDEIKKKTDEEFRKTENIFEEAIPTKGFIAPETLTPFEGPSQVKKEFIDLYSFIEQTVFEEMTDEQKRQLLKEGVIQPSEIIEELNKVVVVSPMSIDAKDTGADWQILADSDAVLSICEETFNKPVYSIKVSFENNNYIMNLNPDTSCFESVIKAPKEKGKYQMIIQIIYSDNSYEELKKSVFVDFYGYIY